MIHDSSLPFWIEGRPKPPNDNEMPQAMFYLAEAGFQQAMGITLKRGRFITPQDDENAPIVIAIDEVFSRTYFPHEDPIGKHVHLEQFNVQAEIVGVVGHVRQWGPGTDAKSAIEAQFFYPFMQFRKASAAGRGCRSRGAAHPGDQGNHGCRPSRGERFESARSCLRGADNARCPCPFLGCAQTVNDSSQCIRGCSRCSFLHWNLRRDFAFIGQRTHEIGVRMALGAQPVHVMRLILGQGVRMALVGVYGIISALAHTRLLASQLFGVTSHDPLMFAGVAILLTWSHCLRVMFRARRAVRVDPLEALRYE